MDANDHLTKAIADAVAQISREMWERMEGDISENDQLAITSAMTKLAVESARLTQVEVAAQVNESGPVISVEPTFISDDYDPWAERYGNG